MAWVVGGKGEGGEGLVWRRFPGGYDSEPPGSFGHLQKTLKPARAFLGTLFSCIQTTWVHLGASKKAIICKSLQVYSPQEAMFVLNADLECRTCRVANFMLMCYKLHHVFHKSPRKPDI